MTINSVILSIKLTQKEAVLTRNKTLYMSYLISRTITIFCYIKMTVDKVIWMFTLKASSLILYQQASTDSILKKNL